MQNVVLRCTLLRGYCCNEAAHLSMQSGQPWYCCSSQQFSYLESLLLQCLHGSMQSFLHYICLTKSLI
jgi:hypothetical protein